MNVLAIETSCDETALAVVSNKGTIHASTIYSQFPEHAAYGGVVPEIAARTHLTKLPTLLEKTLGEAELSLKDIDAICATAGPGLIGGLLVGLNYAKALAFSLEKPFYSINHLAGHALSVRLHETVAFPYMLLLVSGGHTQLIVVHSSSRFTLLGESRDDAAGETFDKTAKLLGLPQPGGPNIEKWALSGNAHAYNFPHPFANESHCDFSFSGLKTAVRTCIANTSENEKANIAASFQRTVAEILYERSCQALATCSIQKIPVKSFVIAGGVAANNFIRNALIKLEKKFQISCIFPPISLCTDNAAMIAWACIEQIRDGSATPNMRAAATPRWPLNQLNREGTTK
ncbi:MAG: tRNA (adenosine(37)-N6)-threonylcarbamoyltransferase complex transferase subunit TsaD [Alphaproteobacteria bacterium]|nr:MAG: tRNA (adenosine(37)-N6)-threonylcarbamoyltransferase complex transferase subunit TsaD [Alphaproteobacteria bacterium]